MKVIDAAAFFEVLIRSSSGLAAERILLEEEVCTPHLFDAEVFHRLVQAGKNGVLPLAEVHSGLDDLRDAPFTRVEHSVLLKAAFEVSAALSGYDALYVALARQLSCPLVTADGRLARTARRQFGLTVEEVTTSGR